MVTPAEKYAADCAAANAAKPAVFTVGDTEVAWVNPEGNMQLVARPLTPQQAKDLRAWIKATFIENA